MAEFVYLVTNVMQALTNRFNDPVNLAALDAVGQQYQEHGNKVYVRRGRAKVQDVYPCVAMEIGSREETWGAISYTKDITVTVDIYGMIKTVGGTKSDKLSLALEDYIIAFGETIQGILNERGKQQYINFNGAGGVIYDSFAKSAVYGFLYQGAVRIVKIPWYGKLWLDGTSLSFVA